MLVPLIMQNLSGNSVVTYGTAIGEGIVTNYILIDVYRFGTAQGVSSLQGFVPSAQGRINFIIDITNVLSYQKISWVSNP